MVVPKMVPAWMVSGASTRCRWWACVGHTRTRDEVEERKSSVPALGPTEVVVAAEIVKLGVAVRAVTKKLRWPVPGVSWLGFDAMLASGSLVVRTTVGMLPLITRL